MRLYLRSTRQELIKIYTSSGFWLSVVLLLSILLTFGVYMDDTGASYNILTTAMKINPSEYAEKRITSQMVFLTTTKSALAMYGMALSALCFTGTICQERKNNVKRYMIFRKGKNCEALSRGTAALISSGTAYALAALICMIVVIILFPDISSVDDYENIVMHYSVDSNGNTIGLYRLMGMNFIYVFQIMGMFLYGCVCGAVGLVTAAFSSSIYLCVSIPFFAGYTYYSIFAGVVMGYVDGSISERIFEGMSNYGTWSNYTCFWQNIHYFGWNLLIIAVLWGIAITVYRVRLGIAKDNGGGA